MLDNTKLARLCYKGKMPKLVDPIARRRELGRALWRVVRRDGLERASVREVAREAAVSTGSLRHYFGSQSELMVFAMRLVIEHIEERLAALEIPAEPLPAARAVFAELLPLDQDRQAENEVWLAFTARALVEPELRELSHEAYDLLRAACKKWVAPLLPGAAAETVEMEADRLFALLDGLAVHGAIRPEQATADHLLAVLDQHLRHVVAAGGGAGAPRGRRGDGQAAQPR